VEGQPLGCKSATGGVLSGPKGPLGRTLHLMAEIFPNEIPSDVSTTRSERVVFEALKRNLPDEYFVYYATPFIAAENAEQGEVDFIIVHPERGMLFLECKGGGIERDHDGSWYRLKGKRRERLARTPAEQAKKQVEALITKFRKPCTRLFGTIEGRFPMAYGWALAFPLSRWEAVNVPPDVEPEIFLDQQILEHTEELIEAAMAFWQRGRAKPSQLGIEEFHTFRHSVLSPELKLVPDFASTEIEKPLVRLTQSQAQVADLLVTSRRLMVSGGSGTGKTLLALHSAQSMASEGKRVLLVCSNSLLADRLRATTDAMARDLQNASARTITLQKGDLSKPTLSFERPDQDGITTPLHMTGIEATKALATSGSETTSQYQRSELQLKGERWAEQLPGTIDTLDFTGLCRRSAYLLNERLEAGAEGTRFLVGALEAQKLGPWDAIIVDQAHDLGPGALAALEAGVAPGGHLTVFYDSSLPASGGLRMPRIGPVVELASGPAF